MSNIKLFEELIRKDYKKIKGFLINSYHIDVNDAEEILGIAIERFLVNNYVEKFDSTQSTLLTYFTNYVKLNYLHKTKYSDVKQREKIQSTINEEGELINPIEVFENVEQKDDEYDFESELKQTHELLQNISKRKVKYNLGVDMLYDVADGMSYDEIALKYNVTLTTVKNYIHLVRKILYKEIREPFRNDNLEKTHILNAKNKSHKKNISNQIKRSLI
jgi:DNA-directed RNA polymerase specialized sigma24 family protein